MTLNKTAHKDMKLGIMPPGITTLNAITQCYGTRDNDSEHNDTVRIYCIKIKALRIMTRIIYSA
jgi:hypothetical protein